MKRFISLLVALSFGMILAPTAYASICFIPNGCTGTSTTPSYGQLLIGGKSGEYEFVASSTLGAVTSVFGRTGAVTAQSGDYTTSLVTEGSNLYYTLTRWASALAGTTTDALAEGITNLYFTNARARAAISGTYPINYNSGTGAISIVATSSFGLTVSSFASPNISQWTNNAGYLTSLSGAASSTLLSDNNTFSGINKFTNASSDFSGTWQTFSPSHFQIAGSYLTASPIATSTGETAGQLAYWTSTNGTPATLGKVATSTLTPSSPLTGSFVQIGSSGSLGCQTASGSQAGCLSSADWTTFNGKQATISATWPILFSANTVSWGGLSTTTNLTTGQLVYASGASSITSVATSTLSASSPLTGSFIQIGSSGSLGIQAASGAQNGYLASADYSLLHAATTTFSAPLTYTLGTNAVTCPSCITSQFAWPWTMLTNYGTTTDATTTPAWFQTGLFASSTSQFTYASTTQLSATSLCLTGDICRTTWPSGGSGIATTSLAATWPIILTITNPAATFSWGGLSTTTNLVSGHVVYSSGAGSITDIATSTPSIGSVLTYSGTLGNLIGGTSGSFSIANSAVTNAMLANSTISGIALGSNLNSLSPNSTLNGSSYNGSAAVSNWGLNLGNSNWWTALQNFTNATTSGFEATSTNIFFSGIKDALLSTNHSGQVVATTSVGVNYLSGILPIANGGTATSTQVTNGMNYFDGTRITSNTALTTDGVGNITLGSTGSTLWAAGASSTDSNAFDIWNPSLSPTLPYFSLRSSGYVGISTSTPISMFTVAGNASIGADSNVAAPTNGLTVEGGILSQASSTIVGALTTTGTNTFASVLNLNGNPNLGSTAITTTDNSNEVIGTNWGWYLKGDATHPVQIIGGALMTGQALGFPAGTTFPSGNLYVNGQAAIGTTTPFWNVTVASSTGPQLALTDTTASSNAWTLRSTGNFFYIATSTATATSTKSAFYLDNNAIPYFPSIAASSGSNCLQIDANGKITNTGAGCASSASGANPTASLGLSAINGSATTFMRSDAAPALSQSIIPTWTGLHTFQVGYVSQASSTVVGNFTTTGNNITNGSVTSASDSITNGTQSMSINPSYGGSLPMFGTISNDPLAFMTNNTERARFTATGLLGIASSTPWGKLTVQGASNSNTPSLVVWNTGSSTPVLTVLGSNSNGAIIMGGTTLDTAGDVLEVKAPNDNADHYTEFNCPASAKGCYQKFKANSDFVSSEFASTDGDWFMGSFGTGDFGFKDSNNGTWPFEIAKGATTSAIQIDANSHISFGGTTSQGAVSSCGTSPKLNGNDDAGSITIGTGAVNACTLTFINTYTNAPHCFVNLNIAAATATVLIANTSATQLIAHASASNIGGSKMDYFCVASSTASVF